MLQQDSRDRNAAVHISRISQSAHVRDKRSSYRRDRRRTSLQPQSRHSSQNDGKAEGYKTVVAPNPCPENKELLIIPSASHCDLYDGGYTEPAGKGEPKNMIPWDKLAEFFNKNLK